MAFTNIRIAEIPPAPMGGIAPLPNPRGPDSNCSSKLTAGNILVTGQSGQPVGEYILLEVIDSAGNTVSFDVCITNGANQFISTNLVLPVNNDLILRLIEMYPVAGDQLDVSIVAVQQCNNTCTDPNAVGCPPPFYSESAATATQRAAIDLKNGRCRLVLDRTKDIVIHTSHMQAHMPLLAAIPILMNANGTEDLADKSLKPIFVVARQGLFTFKIAAAWTPALVTDVLLIVTNRKPKSTPAFQVHRLR